MRTTRIVSLGDPWTTVALEAVSAALPNVLVERFNNRPHVILIHADVDEKDLRGVIPMQVPYRIDHTDVLPFKKPATP